MISLEEAIEQRNPAAALAALEANPAEAGSPTRMGVSPLMLALYYEVPDVAAAIRTRLNELSFFESAAMGELDPVRAAVEANPALVNAFAPDGFTVLGLAIFFRQPALARYLILNGADVNLPAANARKVAPIHAACARQDLDTLKLLLDHAANPDLEQEGGFTPLKAARQSGNKTMEELLLNAGAIRG
ncbi:MAG: ankyrin repeat domain-containing protein [Acidobacteria bacterium]|nr:ankyrin repeat domain-containing protein [Acidobacteriota bacterium]